MKNYNDFSFPFSQTWWIILLFSFLGVLLLTLAELCLPGRLFYLSVVSVFSLGLCSYLQEMFLNSSLNLLDGKETVFSPALRAGNLLLWLLAVSAVFLGFFVFRKKNHARTAEKALVFLSLSMVFIQLSGFFVNLVSMPEADYENAGYLTTEKEFELSGENNVLVFIVDSCSTEIAGEALAEDPALFQRFDGFTWYPDCTSVYSRTYPALIYLLTGEKCCYDIPYPEYAAQAFNNSSFLSSIKAAGTDIQVFTEVSNLGGSGRELVSNFKTFHGKSLEILHPVKLFTQMLHISGYKCLPYAAKSRFQYNVTIMNHLVRDYPSDTFMESDDIAYYSALKEHGVTVSSDYSNAFRLYHLWGAHAAPYMDENAAPSGNTTQVRAFRGSVKIIGDYLDYMRSAGLYDAATVIVMADHGNPYGNDRLEIDEEKTCLMMVKPSGASGALRISDNPVSHENFFRTVLNGFGVENNDFPAPGITDTVPGSDTVRYYYYTAELDHSDGEIALREYAIRGDARIFSNWTLTGNDRDINYSLSKVSSHRLSEFS